MIEVKNLTKSFFGEKVLEDVSVTFDKGKTNLIIHGLAGIWLVLALAFHLAEVGLIGLSVIIMLTAFCG